VAIMGGAGIAPSRGSAAARSGQSCLPAAVLLGYGFLALHETVIIPVAYLVLHWPIGGPVQYVLIVAFSLAGTLLLYDIAVRRSPVTRWLFGLRPRAAGTSQSSRHHRHR
jgi:glucan biosynthesis protein C